MCARVRFACYVGAGARGYQRVPDPLDLGVPGDCESLCQC